MSLTPTKYGQWRVINDQLVDESAQMPNPPSDPPLSSDYDESNIFDNSKSAHQIDFIDPENVLED